MGCFLTIDYNLILMHQEEEESTQNWMLRTDSNHVPPNINLLYNHTYPTISSQGFLEGLARMVLFQSNYSELKSMHHEEEERTQKKILRTDSNHVPPNISTIYSYLHRCIL